MSKMTITVNETMSRQTGRGGEDVTARVEAEVNESVAGNCDAIRDKIRDMFAAARHVLSSGTGSNKNCTWQHDQKVACQTKALGHDARDNAE
ncbi:MAG: hypothetical protein GXP25_03380 [Planctomycetes bacterium]|nr:hypothetical protein [Planctomycetota bacterium]